MKKQFLSLLLLSLLLSAGAVSAQDLKIGYVNAQEILMKMPQRAAVEKKLENFAERKQKEFAEKENEIREQYQQFQLKQGVISEEARKKEEARLNELTQNLYAMQQQMQVDFQTRRNELLQPLIAEIQQAIDAVAKDMKLTYVINAMTGQGEFVILYASEDAQKKYNITDKVKAKLEI